MVYNNILVNYFHFRNIRKWKFHQINILVDSACKIRNHPNEWMVSYMLPITMFFHSQNFSLQNEQGMFPKTQQLR